MHVSNYCKNQKMCEKAVDICVQKFFLKKKYINVVSINISLKKYVKKLFCLSTNIRICSWWLVKNKMLEKRDDVVFANDDIVFINWDYDNVSCFGDDMALVNINVNNVSLDDDNFDDDDPKTVIHVRIMAWIL